MVGYTPKTNRQTETNTQTLKQTLMSIEQSPRASASIRDTHNLQKTFKDIFVF